MKEKGLLPVISILFEWFLFLYATLYLFSCLILFIRSSNTATELSTDSPTLCMIV